MEISKKERDVSLRKISSFINQNPLIKQIYSFQDKFESENPGLQYNMNDFVRMYFDSLCLKFFTIQAFGGATNGMKKAEIKKAMEGHIKKIIKLGMEMAIK